MQTASQTLFADIDHKMEAKRNVIEVNLLFNPSILSTMWQMVLGKVSPEDEPLIKILSEKGDAFVRSGILGMGVVSAFPFLRFVFPKALGYNVQMDYFNTCNKVGKVRQYWLFLYIKKSTNFTVNIIRKLCIFFPDTFSRDGKRIKVVSIDH